jgi:hypothetical protein
MMRDNREWKGMLRSYRDESFGFRYINKNKEMIISTAEITCETANVFIIR